MLVVVTAAAMALLWPRSADLPEVTEPPAPLVTAVISDIETFACPEDDTGFGVGGPCSMLTVELLEGADTGRSFDLEVRDADYPPFSVGDRVELGASSGADGTVEYYVQDFDRRGPLLLLTVLFVATVLAVGRLHGLRSLVGLVLSLLVVTTFIVPAILAGESPFLVAVVGAFAIMLVTLYLSHGLTEMTTAAVVGTAAALGLTLVLGEVFVGLTKLTGFASEEAAMARFAVEGLDLRGLVLAGLVIGALGVLDDVTVSQASTVFAVHDADPSQPRGVVFRRAMRVGRDHIASTVNTLFLAYAGASLVLLVLFSTGGLGWGEIVNSELFAQEAVRTMVGSLGLISAVPLTTALAAVLATRRTRVVVDADGPPPDYFGITETAGEPPG